MKSVTESIHEKSRQRQANWAGGITQETQHLTQHLDDLYAEKRQQLAQARHGRREDIVKRARIESELERLMSLTN